MLVPIARTSLTEVEIQSALEPLRSGWLVQGPQVEAFESKWSKFTGAKYSIATTSCTSAMELSLVALGIGPGDEVIVPAFTWISTANVVEHIGARVVFCDVDIETFNLNLDDMKNKVTSKTKAIMPVHLFGFPAEMDEVMRLAKAKGLAVVEDAACGFGSQLAGRHVGTFGDTGCFSFHPRKAITTGEGGMVTTDNPELAEKIRQLRDHGAKTSDLQRHLGPKPYLLPEFTEAGYNQRMTDVQAALGSSQMDRANEILLERKRLAQKYDQAFADLYWLGVPNRPGNGQHGFQSYPCLFKPKDLEIAISRRDVGRIDEISLERDSWMQALQDAGVSSRPATHAVPYLEYFQHKYKHEPLDHLSAYASWKCSVSLPLFHGMTFDEQEYVIQQVRSRPN
jgi:perosamine synthetase